MMLRLPVFDFPEALFVFRHRSWRLIACGRTTIKQVSRSMICETREEMHVASSVCPGRWIRGELLDLTQMSRLLEAIL